MDEVLRVKHEDFVFNLQGTSIWEMYTLMAPLSIFILTAHAVHYFIRSKGFCSPLLFFLLEYSVLVLPTIFLYTILSDYTYYFFSVVFIIFLYIIGANIREFIRLLVNRNPANSEQPTFITYLRSFLFLLSGICILAVDFRIFPRRLAKTDTYGYSFMDTGVGFFVMAHGLVTKHKDEDDFGSKRKLDLLLKALLNGLPLLMFGCFRFLMLDSLNYQKPTSEYGVHWNFLFTLAFLKLTAPIIMALWPTKLPLVASYIMASHQLLLSAGIESWASKNIPRTNFLTANREGLISLPGYLSLYLLSVALGKRLKKISTPRDKLVQVPLLILTFLLSHILTRVSENLFNISRRFANLTFVLWNFNLFIYILFGFFLIELTIVIYSEKYEIPIMDYTPNILSSINFNGLGFFVISNLLTGLINLMCFTIECSMIESIVILLTYTLATCSTASILHHHKLKLNFSKQ